MSEAQEFGGPINRPANNARQVTPGEALTNAQPSGAGVDFLGLNQQMQREAAPRAPTPASGPAPGSAPGPAPAHEQSWLMEVTDSAPSSLAPAPQELAPSPTAASLLNASWREETPQPRRSRWLIPVASGAVLSALGIIGLPYLRRESAPEPAPSANVVTRPASAVSSGPAAPSVSDESALAALDSEPLLEPVAPDAKLDRPERPRGARAGASLAQVGGRSEAPVNAPDPGSSFITPSDVIDPSGVWTISPGDDESTPAAEGDVDTGEPLDGAPDGVSSSAVEREAPASSAALVGECSTPSARRAALPAEVEVDWDRLVWIARTGELDESRAAVDEGAREVASTESNSAAAGVEDDGIARALVAWAQAHSSEAPESSVETPPEAVGATVDGVAGQVAPALEVVTVAEPEADEVESAPVGWVDEPSEDVAVVGNPETDCESELEAESSATASELEARASVDALPAPESTTAAQPVIAPHPESAPQPENVTQPENAPLPENVTQPESAPQPENVTQPENAPLPESAPQPEAAAETLTAAEPARVRVLSRAGGRGGERRLAAERRRARRQQELAELSAPATEVEGELADLASDQPSLELVAAPAEPLAPRPEASAGAVVADPLPAPVNAPTSHDAVEVPAPAAPLETSAAPETPSSSAPVSTPVEVSEAPSAEPQQAQQALPQPATNSDAPVHPPSNAASAVANSASASTPNVPSAVEQPGAAAASASPAPVPPSKPREPEPHRVLQVASAADMEHVWASETIPLEALDGKSTLATPHIGPTRVVFHTGEVFEGELVAIGEGRLWLRNSVGRIALDGARVKSAHRIAPGASLSTQAAQAKQLAGLPRARVKTPGGLLHGRVLERNERVTTLIMNSGARIVLDSRSVEVLEDVPLVQIRQ